MSDRVVLEGVDRYRVMDPNYEAVRIVLAQRGERYSPEYLQGISGEAFRIAGPCPCAPTCSCMMDTPALGRLLGYQVEVGSLHGQGEARKASWGPIADRIKSEVRAGRPVIVWHAFTNYEWDVVLGFDEEKGVWIGRGSWVGNQEPASAPQARPLEGADVTDTLALFFGRKTGPLDAREAELAALEEAIHHAHSPSDPFLAEADDRPLPWRFREGLACYRAWICTFRTDPGHVPGAGDRYPLGVYRSTRRAAAGFLREIAPQYPASAPHFEQAADLFALEAEALDECYEKLCGGWEGWQKPDPSKAARMVELLTRAHRSYKSGIKEIEFALEAVDRERLARAHRPAVVDRGNGRATLERVRTLGWGRGRDCTFCGALEAALAVTAHPYTYSDLMGLSGLAFRVRWANEATATKWCPSAAVGEMPDEMQALSELTGWKLQAESVEGRGSERDRLRERLVTSFNAGRPVLVYPPHWNMALAYGYEDEGRTLLVRDYLKGDEPLRLPVDQLQPLQIYLHAYRDPPRLRECLLRALRAALCNHRRERGDGGLRGREYWYGRAALRAWIGDLRDADHYPEKTQQALFHLACFSLASLRDARRSAVSFLRDWCTVLDGRSPEALRRAAGLYEKETKALQPLLADRKPGEADGKETLDEWFARGRLREAAALAEALQLESAAMAEIEAALAR